ncbi:S1/P1 nuclease [Endozoicomonas arenosclerae]|uniref:S1/P1 nuclease n=1 Tax=Endozoicomonas arenosclerae TaxID=1633495 RepID=UPI000783ED17|nr:S1/P1 nuclease [Endozoicomonas arenosclerae]
MLGNLIPGRFLRAGGYGLVLFCSVNTHAWHDLGHMMIGQLASDQIVAKYPDVSGYMEKLLKKAQDYYSSDFNTDQLSDTAKAASFLDTYSSKNRDSKSWHYINGPYVPPGDYSKVDETALSDAYSELPNAPIEIAVSLGVLQNSRDSIKDGEVSDEAAQAYIKLLHIVGDIHQPLHTMERFDEQNPQGDRGGNEFPISGVPGVDNLHSLWDSIGMKFGDVRWDDKDADTKLADALKSLKDFVGDKPNYPADIQALSTMMDPWDLASGLYLAGKDLVYSGVEYNQTVSEAYQGKVQQYSQYLVYMAGQMLSDLLVFALTGQEPESRSALSLRAYGSFNRTKAETVNQLRHVQEHQKYLASQKAIEGKQASGDGITYSYWKIVNDWAAYHWPDRQLKK